ncbi:Helicase associated domain protein [Streptomyces sp. KR80]|uniref:Helicase associated domain protein n=1 Tax=Streptomyces sp. KR80 TaxID=3457426 RepID=UPI003FD351BC
MSDIELRPHQIEAVDAIVRALELSALSEVPAEGLRATAVAATGSGKTIVAAKVAQRLEPQGRILVLVPTLDLLTQTVLAWRGAGHRGPVVAVCSLGRDAVLEAVGVRCTTIPTRLALWAGSGPVTVFATYASLGVLEKAHAGSYGQVLKSFGLVIVDEAHRTSGYLVGPARGVEEVRVAWSAVHDNARIRAARRLYLTATPRIWEPRGRVGALGMVGVGEGVEEVEEGAGRPGVGQLVASMDDPAVYGSRCFTLSLTEAIDREILARFEIDVLEIRDPVGAGPGEDAGSEEGRGRRLAALQAALLSHAAAENLSTIISFHHRVIEAMAFAAKLPQTAARLWEADPVEHMPPHRVWADWLCGDHDAEHRRAVLDQFAHGLDARGVAVNRAVLANVKVLGEGVDIRGTRGVDAVFFADVRGSAIDIVQAVGRALRQEPGEGKVARLIVPVLLAPDENPEDMLASASYAPLVAVLEGLRAHDEQLVEQLAVRQATSRSRPPSPVRTGEDQPAGAGEERSLLTFATPRDPELIAQFVRTRVIRPESRVWLAGLNALRTWRAEYGHARVPFDIKVPQGEGVFPLGGWVSEQRRAYRAGTLAPWRIELLEELGMIWSAPDLAWQENLDALRSYHATHGTVAAPRSAVAGGKPVGVIIANLRRPGGLGKDPQRAAERARQLAAVDPDWNCSWPLDWQRLYTKLRSCLDGGATLAELLPGVRLGGEDVGRWLSRQRESWSQLSDEQQHRLAQLGIAPGAPTGAEKRAPAAVTHADAFTRGITALKQFKDRTGHVRVPRPHVEKLPDGTPVRLGIWLANQKQRRTRLARGRAAALAELGIDWA